MLQPISQTDQAFRDTLITYAKSYALDNLAAFFGFPRLRIFQVPAWQKSLHAIAYGRRGTLGTTHASIENLFMHGLPSYTVSVSTGSPNIVNFMLDPNGQEFGPGVGFACQDVQRLWRLVHPTYFPEPGILVWSTGPTVLTGSTYGNKISVCPVETTYWKSGDWKNHFENNGIIVPDEGITANGIKAYRLPFWYMEPNPGPVLGAENLPDDYDHVDWGIPCLFQMFVDDYLIDIPNAYLLDPAGVDKATIDPTMPYGPHIMNLFNFDNPTEQVGSQLTGPYPLYLDDITLSANALEKIWDKTLAAGVFMRVNTVDFCKGQEQNTLNDLAESLKEE